MHAQEIAFNDIINVNSLLTPYTGDVPQKIEQIRSTEEEKQSQLKRLRDFKARQKDEFGPMLARLQRVVIENQNVFEVGAVSAEYVVLLLDAREASTEQEADNAKVSGLSPGS